jgi:hypothetical protein
MDAGGPEPPSPEPGGGAPPLGEGVEVIAAVDMMPSIGPHAGRCLDAGLRVAFWFLLIQ